MKNFIYIFMLLALSSCGSLYRSSKVIEGMAGGAHVDVVPITTETVGMANAFAYQPKSLPEIFSVTAGSGSGLKKFATLPKGPVAKVSQKSTHTSLPPKIDPRPYSIGIGDVVLISIPLKGSSIKELTGLLVAQSTRQGYTVQDDGAINIPKVGRVEIAGKTIKQAEALLFQKLVENQIEPSFSLEIAEFNSRKVSVDGAVERPVIVPITLTPLYLDEALAAAGGITAKPRSEALVRLYRKGKLYQIPASHVFAKSGRSRVRMIDGDAIFVDPQRDMNLAQDYFQQEIQLIETQERARENAISQLKTEVDLRRQNLREARENYRSKIELGAEDRDYVYLVGEVSKQTRFSLPLDRHAKLTDALLAAGGISSETGDVSQVYVLRGLQVGSKVDSITAWHLDARNAAGFILAAHFEMRPNDIVFVAQQPITRWDRAVSQIIPSFYSASSQIK